jgi:hypothetical protein
MTFKIDKPFHIFRLVPLPKCTLPGATSDEHPGDQLAWRGGRALKLLEACRRLLPVVITPW